MSIFENKSITFLKTSRFFFQKKSGAARDKNFGKLSACKSILAHPTFALAYVSNENGLISSSRLPSGAARRQGPKTRGVMDPQSREGATTILSGLA